MPAAPANGRLCLPSSRDRDGASVLSGERAAAWAERGVRHARAPTQSVTTYGVGPCLSAVSLCRVALLRQTRLN
jgi:hypothetical protein